MPPGKVIQVLAWRHILLVLTDLGEIWVLHGLESRPQGSTTVALEWRKLSFPVSLDPFPMSAW